MVKQGIPDEADLLIPENERLFKTPFSPLYWKLAFEEFKKPKIMALAALIIAIRVVIGIFSIPVAGMDLKMTFGFFFNALGSMIYGPIVALISGAVSDLANFILFPSGYPLFLGYTLNAMLSSFFFAIFLYRARLSVWRCALARASVNIFVNVFLGCTWSAMLYSKGYLYYLGKSYLKNVILLPLEIILLAFFLYEFQPILLKFKLIPKQERIKITKVHIVFVVAACVLLAAIIGVYVYNLIFVPAEA